MNKIRKLILTGLLIASCVVLGRILSIRTPIITIGFSFVPIMLAGILMGWKRSAFVASISDIIGALLFPTGSYFFGFTLSSFLTGLVYGLLLYRKEFKVDKKFIIRLFISTLIVTGLINGLLNTIWIFMITNGAANIVVPVRILKQLVMIPVKMITMISLLKLFEDKIRGLLND